MPRDISDSQYEFFCSLAPLICLVFQELYFICFVAYFGAWNEWSFQANRKIKGIHFYFLWAWMLCKSVDHFPLLLLKGIIISFALSRISSRLYSFQANRKITAMYLHFMSIWMLYQSLDNFSHFLKELFLLVHPIWECFSRSSIHFRLIGRSEEYISISFDPGWVDVI